MAEPILLRNEESGSYLFWCPGCKFGHVFYVHKPSPHGYQWTFNGNMEKPTFRASLLIPGHKSNPPYRSLPRCHLFVTDGMIQYCSDCEHELAGKTVPMEPF